MKRILLLFVLFFSCRSIPQRVQVSIPEAPKKPIINAEKVENGVLIQENEFVELVQYIEKMRIHVKELNAYIQYYRGE